MVVGPSLNEDTLIRQAQGGDVSAFEELVRRHEEPVFRAAYLILHDPAEAEDVAQEAFLKAFRALGRFPGQGASSGPGCCAS